MTHFEIYNTYKKLMPFYSCYTIHWFPYGSLSIKIRQEDQKEFIFTYINENDWMFETIGHFLARTKGGEEM